MALAGKNYNYARFIPEFYTPSSQTSLKPGDGFPDVCLETLKGPQLCISEFKNQWIVMETGSITCPHYIAHIRVMNRLMKQFPDVVFLVIYVREAHPGEKIPAHESYAHKRHLAHMVYEGENEQRLLIVDTLDGKLHHLLGQHPNGVYVINPQGQIVFSCSWNNPKKIYRLLKMRQTILAVSNDPGNPPFLFPHTLFRVLIRAGYKAVWNMIQSLPKIWWEYHNFQNKK